jgi:2'-hydroxyisoflavone reductase
MKLLLLGGTQFLGRHLVEIALQRSHQVTVFTRGRRALPEPIGSAVAKLVGDRDPRVAPGLDALSAGQWDAVIDLSGYVPRVVGASASLLADRVARYVFVSSISVYAKLDRPGLDETAPLATLENADSEEIAKDYGALKAACEAAVTNAFGTRATHVRPGLIVGPYDPTDRFGYWPARFVHPQLLGDRGPLAVVPAPPETALQFIDARDLAAFILDLVERDVGGAFNATSPPGQWTFGDLVEECRHASPSPPEPLWVSERTLLDFHVEPWMGLPLWIPSADPDTAGFQRVSTRRAQDAGLRTRPLAQTVADTAQWLASRSNEGAWKHVLSDSRERQLVSAVRPASPPETSHCKAAP